MNPTSEDGDYSAPEDPSHSQPHTKLTPANAAHAPRATAKARNTPQAGA
ncbi:hypothetical protein [Jonesia quinghaiensis]|nr:hypothetical protein [Jonesia quinghaiensis]